MLGRMMVRYDFSEIRLPAEERRDQPMAVTFGPATGMRAVGDASAEVLFLDHDPPLVITAEVREVQGVPQVVAVEVRSTGWRYLQDATWPDHWTEDEKAEMDRLRAERAAQDDYSLVITSDLLRSLPLRELKRAVLAVRRGEHASAYAELDGVRRVGMERKGQEHYEKVARVYEDAVANGIPTLPAIAQEFGVGTDAAKKYIRIARQRGLLGYPARPGVPGATEASSPIKHAKPKKSATKKRSKP